MTSIDAGVPEAIRRAAEQVSAYFENRGVLVWQLGNIRSKGFESSPDERNLAALRRLAQNIEITGPDEDKLVWLVFHGKNTTGKAMINVGHKLRLTAQVALLFEAERRNALGLVLPEDADAETAGP